MMGVADENPRVEYIATAFSYSPQKKGAQPERFFGFFQDLDNYIQLVVVRRDVESAIASFLALKGGERFYITYNSVCGRIAAKSKDGQPGMCDVSNLDLEEEMAITNRVLVNCSPHECISFVFTTGGFSLEEATEKGKRYIGFYQNSDEGIAQIFALGDTAESAIDELISSKWGEGINRILEEQAYGRRRVIVHGQAKEHLCNTYPLSLDEKIWIDQRLTEFLTGGRH